jgi:hypothetical protein
MAAIPRIPSIVAKRAFCLDCMALQLTHLKKCVNEKRGFSAACQSLGRGGKVRALADGYSADAECGKGRQSSAPGFLPPDGTGKK